MSGKSILHRIKARHHFPEIAEQGAELGMLVQISAVYKAYLSRIIKWFYMEIL